MRTIAICNQKGGVGKTTISVLLAVAATRSGERVLLLDLLATKATRRSTSTCAEPGAPEWPPLGPLAPHHKPLALRDARPAPRRRRSWTSTSSAPTAFNTSRPWRNRRKPSPLRTLEAQSISDVTLALDNGELSHQRKDLHAAGWRIHEFV
jgi:hypothetical protein